MAVCPYLAIADGEDETDRCARFLRRMVSHVCYGNQPTETAAITAEFTAPNPVMVVLGTTIHEFVSSSSFSLSETRGWSDQV